MVEVKTQIINRLGMHARAAAKFVKLAGQFESEITIGNAGKRANGKSIMSVMMLGATKGTALEITANGPDETPAVDALLQLIETRFGEEE